MANEKIDNTVRIYCDGGCSGNQSDENFGGWGAILEYRGRQKELYGSEANTTNNKMELTALVNALSALKKDGLTVCIFSDSAYIINCFKQKWYEAWEKNGWKNSKKQAVENQPLWEELLFQVRRQLCTFYKVKGHLKLDAQSGVFKSEYKKFNSENSLSLSVEEFLYVSRMNHRADELANIAIGQLKESLKTN